MAGLRGLDQLSLLLPRCRHSLDVFEATLRVLNQNFSVARSLVLLRPGEGGYFMLHGWVGARDLPEELVVTVGHGTLGVALQLGQTMIESRQFSGGGCLFDWERSALMAPGPAVAVYLGAPGPAAFKEEDRGYLEVMAALVGYALRDVRTS